MFVVVVVVVGFPDCLRLAFGWHWLGVRCLAPWPAVYSPVREPRCKPFALRCPWSGKIRSFDLLAGCRWLQSRGPAGLTVCPSVPSPTRPEAPNVHLSCLSSRAPALQKDTQRQPGHRPSAWGRTPGGVLCHLLWHPEFAPRALSVGTTDARGRVLPCRRPSWASLGMEQRPWPPSTGCQW